MILLFIAITYTYRPNHSPKIISSIDYPIILSLSLNAIQWKPIQVQTNNSYIYIISSSYINILLRLFLSIYIDGYYPNLVANGQFEFFLGNGSAVNWASTYSNTNNQDYTLVDQTFNNLTSKAIQLQLTGNDSNSYINVYQRINISQLNPLPVRISAISKVRDLIQDIYIYIFIYLIPIPFVLPSYQNLHISIYPVRWGDSLRQ